MTHNGVVKILDIGSGVGSVAEKIFDFLPEKEITRLDADPGVNPDILHDIAKPLPEKMQGQYDIVLISHVLEHIDRKDVINVFRQVISAVRNLGEVWVIVPSLEWAANEIINRREGIHIQGAIFGAQFTPWDYHKCGFTLLSLRYVVELCGLIIRRAYQSPFKIVLDGHEYGSLQNIVIGARYDALNDPADAIEGFYASAETVAVA